MGHTSLGGRKYFDEANVYVLLSPSNTYYRVALIAGEQGAGWTEPRTAAGRSWSWEAPQSHLLLARLLCLFPSVQAPGLRPAQCRAKRFRQRDAYCSPRGKIPHFSTSHWEDIFPLLLFILGNEGAVAQPGLAFLPPCIYSVGMAAKDHHHFFPCTRHLAVIG